MSDKKQLSVGGIANMYLDASSDIVAEMNRGLRLESLTYWAARFRRFVARS